MKDVISQASVVADLRWLESADKGLDLARIREISRNAADFILMQEANKNDPGRPQTATEAANVLFVTNPDSTPIQFDKTTKENTMLFEVAILEKSDDGTKLVLGPIAVVAANRDAAIVAAMGRWGDNNANPEHLEVLVRPFVGS